MKILLPRHLEEGWRNDLSFAALDLEPVSYREEDGAPDADPSGAEIVLRSWVWGNQIRRLVEEIPSVRWLHSLATGVDDLIVLPRIASGDVKLSCARGVHAIPIAEVVVQLLLDSVKKAREHFEAQRNGIWESLRLGELTGQTVLFFGFGGIGREAAKRLAPFGTHIVAVRRGGTGTPEGDAAAVYPTARFEEFLKDADFVVVVAPLTPETRGYFNRRRLGLMKPTAKIVNVSRGEIIPSEELLSALAAGRPGGAVLDVSAEEPLPLNHPYWSHPLIVITPHDSWSSPRTKARNRDFFLENLRRWRLGVPLHGQVNPGESY